MYNLIPPPKKFSNFKIKIEKDSSHLEIEPRFGTILKII